MKKLILTIFVFILLFSFGCSGKPIIDDNKEDDKVVDPIEDPNEKEPEVDINEDIKLEGIELIIKNNEIYIGEKVEFDVKFIPEGATNKEYNIIISDESVLSKSFIGLKEGRTIIKIEAIGESIYSEYEIKVHKVLNPDLLLNKDEIELVIGDEYEIEYQLIDTSVTPTFKTNSNLIELNNNKVIAKEEGIAIIEIELLGKVKEFKVVINPKPIDPIEVINEVISGISIPDVTDCDINLPTLVNGVEIDWTSSDRSVMSDQGEVYFTNNIKRLTLYATFTYDEVDVDKKYYINVKPWSDEARLNKAMEEIVISSTVTSNITLPTSLKYGVSASWTSSNEAVISNKGIVNFKDQEVDLILTVKLNVGEKSMEKQFSVHTLAKKKMNLHYFVERANEFNKKNLNNLELKNGKICLKDGEVYGFYDSEIYETLNFGELVGSFAAITSKSCTCELLVKVKVGSSWSKYFTYGIWGLGRNNLYYNQNDTMARMDTDEILVSTKDGCAYQYRIILRRDNVDVASPELSLVAITMRIEDSNYKYDVDVSNLPDFVDYDVPKVNQNVVPEIGGVICSPTTSTMLLKWKGLDFSSYDQYENRYIAGLVADRGHNNPTYGNWVYNTVTMSAFGFDAYVKHMTSWEELKWHLANVGPVGASIKGDAVLYTTGGHLIVVRGYRVVGNTTYVICNDPNINQRFGNDKNGNPYFVYYEFPLNVFLNFWRKTTYIIE